MTDRYTEALARDEAPPQWFWLAYDPDYETTAEYQLQDRAGCETYLPRCLTPAGDVRPFLEFYMAILVREPQWGLITTCVGVEAVLKGASAYPTPCKPEIVEAIRALEDGEPVEIGKGMARQTVRPITLGGRLSGKLPVFAKGEQVVINRHEWSGVFDAVVQEVDAEKRTATVLASILGRETPITVSQDDLMTRDAAARLEACARGGRKGGPSRAERLSPQRRSEIASKAARERWAR